METGIVAWFSQWYLGYESKAGGIFKGAMLGFMWGFGFGFLLSLIMSAFVRFGKDAPSARRDDDRENEL